MRSNLKVTIITVCYNSVNMIESTIQSVINQTYDNIEYIIIDGGSTDGTINIIKKYSDRIHYWVSEPDRGIFDAMNKGINVASGEYINFMNAGDLFYDNNVIRKFVSKIPTEDILAGIAQVKIPSLYFTRYWTPVRKNFKFIDIKDGMAANHQSTFTRRSQFKSGYDIKSNIIADDLFFIKSIVYEGASYRPLDIIVSKYDPSGISSSPKSKERRDKERSNFYRELQNREILEKYRLTKPRLKGYSYCRHLYYRIFNQLYPRMLIFLDKIHM